MERYKLGDMEKKFADLIWANAPIRSGELAKLCLEAFGWKRTTTYTMLKRLCGAARRRCTCMHSRRRYPAGRSCSCFWLRTRTAKTKRHVLQDLCQKHERKKAPDQQFCGI